MTKLRTGLRSGDFSTPGYGKIGDLMFSKKKESYDPEREPELILPAVENPRVQALAKKSRAGIVDGKPVSKNKVFQYRDAIFEAAFHRFQNDSTLVAYGEENRDWGGAFACYRGLTESLPYHACSIHRFPKPPSSEAPWAMPWKEEGSS